MADEKKTFDITPDYAGLERIAFALQAQVADSERTVRQAGELLDALHDNGFSVLSGHYFTLVCKGLEALIDQEERRIAAINAELPVQKPQRETRIELTSGVHIAFGDDKTVPGYPVRFVIYGIGGAMLTADEAIWFSKQLALRANEEG